jgi:hypothetical protein
MDRIVCHVEIVALKCVFVRQSIKQKCGEGEGCWVIWGGQSKQHLFNALATKGRAAASSFFFMVASMLCLLLSCFACITV